MSEDQYGIIADGKPVVIVEKEDMVILRNCKIDPEMLKALKDMPHPRILILSDRVEAIVVRGCNDANNVITEVTE